MIPEENIDYLPAILHEASTWLTQLEKTVMQISMPNERESLINKLQGNHWVKTQSWVRLVKQLGS